jgi:hypothetical protein
VTILTDDPETSHVRVAIPRWKKSEALLSVGESNTAILFVHGFFGDRRKTWINFQGMVDSSAAPAWWSRCDLYFYSYPSVRRQVAANAQQLERFLADIFPTPRQQMLRLERPYLPNTTLPYRSYKELIVVGHSEGSVLLRYMILNRFRGYQDRFRLEKKEPKSEQEKSLRRDSLLASTLVGFAPAHLGRNVSGLAALIPRYLLATSNAYNNLSPDATFIKSLKEETEEVASRYQSLTALLASSVFGTLDSVVVIGQYKTDWRHTVLGGHNHRSVCKPLRTYMLPLELVKTAYDRDQSIHNSLD